MSRQIWFEIGGGSDLTQSVLNYRRTNPPDWVKLALLDDFPSKSVRLLYADGSFSEWRLCTS